MQFYFLWLFFSQSSKPYIKGLRLRLMKNLRQKYKNLLEQGLGQHIDVIVLKKWLGTLPKI